MATSGVDVITRTAREVIKRAFVLINVVPARQAVQADDELYAVDTLNDMMQSWTTLGVTPWRKQSAVYVPIAGQGEYAITQRPLEIIDMRWANSGGTEIPMEEITHDEYFELPNKTVQGTPSQFYHKRDRTTSTLFVWPVPQNITTERFRLTYNRRTQIVQGANVNTEEVDVPQEWLDTVTYCLAERLVDAFGAKGESVNRVIARANKLFAEAMAYEREGSISFLPDDAY